MTLARNEFEQIIINKDLSKKTLTPKELAEVLGIGYVKALELTKIKGFPAISVGTRKLIVASRLDSWLEENIGEVL